MADTFDKDPTSQVRSVVSKIAKQQGGTVPAGRNLGSGKHEPGHMRDLQFPGDPSGDNGWTPGDYKRRNFGPEDNVSNARDEYYSM